MRSKIFYILKSVVEVQAAFVMLHHASTLSDFQACFNVFETSLLFFSVKTSPVVQLFEHALPYMLWGGGF